MPASKRRSIVGEVLSRRALNRAMLERQLLLRRHAMPAHAVVEHLLGLQAQIPRDPYTAVWTRLEAFDAHELSTLLLERRVVRTTLMRSTIHLVTAADAHRLRRLMQPVIFRMNRDSVFGRVLDGVDLDALADAGRRIVEARPRSNGELGRELAERWPDRPPAALANAARTLVPMAQITPRGVWGRSLQPTWTTVDCWLEAVAGGDRPEPLTVDGMILRYLAAFGPAMVKDVQAWSGLTRLTEVVDRLRPQLRTFRDEDGRELFDLPDAPRPDPDVPAPVRFLPEYDNLVLGLADRSRLVAARAPLPRLVRDGVGWGQVMVDGLLRGMWRIFDEDGTAALVIASTGPYSKPEEDAIIDEGLRLLALHAAGVDSDRLAVRFPPPG